MANNYFGFAPGGVQYGSNGAPQPFAAGPQHPFGGGQGPQAHQQQFGGVRTFENFHASGSYQGGAGNGNQAAYGYYDQKGYFSQGPQGNSAMDQGNQAEPSFQTQSNGNWMNRNRGGPPGRGFRGGRGRGARGARGGGPPPSPRMTTATTYYCDVCRISCAGSQTYQEHLQGTKHKKKEVAAKAGPAAALPRGGSALHCGLCDVTCTGSDAYAAHIRGSKHQRTLKLHQKMGKPIPSLEPTIISNKDEQETEGEAVTGSDKVAQKTDAKQSGGSVQMVETPSGEKVAVPKLPVEHEFEPIGVDYIEETRGPGDKITGYKCKLCDCQFNDLNAKDLHVKGRRHRTQYKRKVDPTIDLGSKSGLGPKQRDFMPTPPAWVGPDMGPYPEWGMGPCPPGPMAGPGMMPPFGPGPGFFGPPLPAPPPMPFCPPDVRVFTTLNDRFVMVKGSDLSLKDEDRNVLFKMLGNVEKALRAVGDSLSVSTVKPDPDATEPPTKIIKGILRVGDVADGLLLKAEPRAEVVVLCAAKPTSGLLKQVLDNLPKELATASGKEDAFNIVPDGRAGFDIVSTDANIHAVIGVTLTSPLMRVDNFQKGSTAGETQGSDVTDTKGSAGGSAASATPADPPDVLDREKCLEALAQLRHSKWFQARLSGSHPSALTIRILRDMKSRHAIWGVLTPWAIQLLTHKALVSALMPIAAADILKRALEILSAGLLLPDGPGLLDPCEREATDAAAALSDQQREDLTANAQMLLRMFCFRKVNKLLGMEKPREQPKRGVEKEPAETSPEKKVKVEPVGEPEIKMETG